MKRLLCAGWVGLLVSQGWVFAEPAELPPLPNLDQPAEAPEAMPAVRVSAPPEVIAAAVDAVARLGNEVVMGRFTAAIEQMNPQWKERTALRLGGMDVLERQLQGVADQMVQQGISMIKFTPHAPKASFEVAPGKSMETVNGQVVEKLIFHKWLVLVPTTTKFRIIRPDDAKPIFIDSTGFQVAVADKGKNNWSFIDGAGISVSELRSLYPTLPQDLELPPTEKKESR